MLIWLILGILLLVTGKYGDYDVNKRFGASSQVLCAYKIVFNFKYDSGFLDYLSGLEITI